MTTLRLTALILLISHPVLSDEPALSSRDRLVVETVLRLKDFDLNSSAPARTAVLKYLRAEMGSQQAFELIERFEPVEISEALSEYCLQHSGETSGVRGAELLFAMQQGTLLEKATKDPDVRRASAAAELIGFAAGRHSAELLGPLVTQDGVPAAVRVTAATGLGRTSAGRELLLKLVTTGKLPDEVRFVAANVLLSADEEAIRTEAGKYLQLPATADSRPLPTVAELIKMEGSPEQGAVVFKTVGTCHTCHKVRGEGKEVGPDLSEIGSKLSRDALYVSILDPSAAISHNFESYLLITVDGLSFTGLLISDTDEGVTLRSREGIDRKFPRDTIEEFEKQKLSLMPKDLQKLLTIEQLVNLVEYLATLKKPGA
ncbi:MAG: hypothetical protein R3C49_20130 [Planctomycetaceae bacterium]